MRPTRIQRFLEASSKPVLSISLLALILTSPLASAENSQAAEPTTSIPDSQSASSNAFIELTPADNGQHIRIATTETTYTLAEVAAKNTRTNCWTIVSNQVYNITSYINSHPGGANAISKLCGVDGTTIFNNIHGGSSTQTNILASYKIGTLFKEPVTSCEAGYFFSSIQGTCTPAPTGYFVTEDSSAAGTSTATPCPIGKFTDATGSTECTPAPPGYFVDSQASTVAKQCLEGSFSSLSGSNKCETAAKGFYVATKGSPLATACAPGYTTAATGSTTASSCYKPIAQTIPGFSAPKALKYLASTNLAITTNTKSLANYKVSGPCTAKVVSIVTKVNGKNVTTKMLKVTASKKAGICSVTISSAAKDKYLAMSKPVTIKVSQTSK